MKVFKAFFDDFNIVTVNMFNSYYRGDKTFKIYDSSNNIYIDTIEIRKESDDNFTYLTLSFNHPLNIGQKYYIVDEYHFMHLISYRLITHRKRFDELFYCDENMGVNYSKEETIFKLWAPTAYKVILRLDDEYIPMTKNDKGIFRTVVNKDVLNKKYTYLVDVNGVINEASDPYALRSGPNGSYSIVASVKEINNKHNIIKHDSIYEVSVRDYSDEHSFNSLKNRIPYLASLNVSTIQLMPVYDFESVDDLNKDKFYNWGYDPSQYFTFEGTYSDNPLEDFKSLVEEFHKYNLNVTLDYVFNHVFDVDTFSLNKIVPYYFFNYKDFPNMELTTYSGCQNDFRSSAKMSYKFFKDVLSYLITYFDVDGFRFDLMGLLDLNCVKNLYKDLKQIKSNIIFYGEGWNMNPYMNGATIENAKEIEHVSFFNDYYRDNLINLLKGDYSKWYYVIDTLKGNHDHHFMNPLQSINYIECHDGYTFFDNVKRCIRGSNATKLCDLGMAFITLSQGICFFHQGQEVYHSKKGYSNSYNLGDEINHIDEMNKDNILSKLMEIRHNNQDCFYSTYEDVAKYVRIIMKDDCIYYFNKYLTAILNYSDKNVDITNKGNILLSTSTKQYLEPYTFIIMKGVNASE